jgi:excisionase family DNA binding protein
VVEEKPLAESNRYEVMTASEVAMHLRCSKAHIYKAINGKLPGVSTLPAIALGRRRLVRRSALEEWKRENEHGAAMIDPSLQNHAVDA